MQRAFVQYPGLRSTTTKYDPCHCGIPGGKRPISGLDCNNCRAYLISDRFLGDEFQKRVMQSRMRYAYCIIADTWECNFRCWFCYSHHYWSEAYEKHGDKIARTFLTPEILARQFRCKLERIHASAKHMDKNRPFTMIRISGGEPLYAMPMNQIPAPSVIDYPAGIGFWLDFFEAFDREVAELKQQGKIFFATSAEWPTFSTGTSFPVALQDYSVDDGTPIFDNTRVIIRFDTNGLIFSDTNIAGNSGAGKVHARRFLNGIYELHEKGKLNNLCIRLTLSFKGSTPTEFDWTRSIVKKNVSSENNDTEFRPSQHPQYSAYVNLHDELVKLQKKNNAFIECVYLNPERGVMHQGDNKVFVFYNGAIDWQNFSSKTGIQLSPVRNDFNLLTDKTIKAMIWRYVGKNAVVKASFPGTRGQAICIVQQGPIIRQMIDQFTSFFSENKRRQGFMIEVYPK